MIPLQSGWRNEFDKLSVKERNKALEKEKEILKKIWKVNQREKEFNENSLLKTINKRWHMITNTPQEEGEWYGIEELFQKYEYNHINVMIIKNKVHSFSVKQWIKRILWKPYYAIRRRTVDKIIQNIWDADGHTYDYYSKIMQQCYDIDGHLYDYYIKLRETDTDEIRLQCLDELNTQLNKLFVASKNMIALFGSKNYQRNEMLTAREEAKQRIKFFKHIIEDCDGYKNLYVKGVQIAQENDLQRLFRFVWYGTTYKVDAESNSGRGQTDFIISKGQANQNIVEFKLASNSKLAHVFTQVKIYEAANCADGSLIVIFYFSEEEHAYSKQVIEDAGYEDMIDDAIFLIDCRNDNKISASKA